MKKTGLTLGKFTPFHKGHQFLIEKALSEVDELIILIYETTSYFVPLSIRANWIRKIYPQVKVIECRDGPEGFSNERSFEITQEKYILKMLNGKIITHFYSSEFYGKHVSKALNADDCRVDENRSAVKISATMIREDTFKYRNFLNQNVYSDLITKVVFLGAMSTGKSTITEALAKKYDTNFRSEYGRDYWAEHQVNRRLNLEAFNKIAKGHIEREDNEIVNANKYFFVDTNAITTYMYALDYHGKAPDYLAEVASQNYQRYDLFFLCGDEIPYDATWDRSGSQKREIFQKQITADLKERNIPYIELKGNLEQRIAKVDAILLNFKKYENFSGSFFHEKNY